MTAVFCLDHADPRSDERLLPCPSCRGGIVSLDGCRSPFVWATCSQCQMVGPIRQTDVAAIDGWNALSGPFRPPMVVEDMLDAAAEAANAELTRAEQERVKAEGCAQTGDTAGLSHHSTQSEKFRHAAHCLRRAMYHQQAITDAAADLEADAYV